VNFRLDRTAKGVQIEHRGTGLSLWSGHEVRSFTADDCTLQFNSFTFDASLEQILPRCWLVRAGPAGARGWSPTDLLRQVKEQQLTVITMPCDYWHAVIAEWSADPEQLTGQRLKLIIAGGSSASRGWAALAQSHCTPTRLFNVYAPPRLPSPRPSLTFPRHAQQEQPEVYIPIAVVCPIVACISNPGRQAN